MMNGRVLLLSALAALLAVLPAGSGHAASWLELNFYLSGPRYDGVLPPCDHQRALDKIATRFRQKEHKFWDPELAIVAFEDIRETAFRPWAANTIPRRFCSGNRGYVGRAPAHNSLCNRRGHRHDRRKVGGGVVRGWARSQLGLQPSLQDGATLRACCPIPRTPR